MRRFFVTTIDVEPDAIYPSWRTSSPLTFRGVFEGINILEEIADQEGVKFTYLLQPVVLRNEKCVSMFKQISGELGTHLHGDYIEPLPRYQGPDFSGCNPIDKQRHYSPNLEYAKLQTLTNLYKKQFDENPKSFRAGRFGLGEKSLGFLNKLGYSHDTSVVPCWKHFKKHVKRSPYIKQGIIEVPISVDNRLKWLRPSMGYSNKKDLKKIILWLVKKGINIACSMFHNVELVPGTSPYCGSKNSQQKLIDRIKTMIDILHANHYNSICLKHVKP